MNLRTLPTSELDEAYDAWKAADARALALEAKVEAAWERYDCALGDPPTHQLMQQAWRRRARATEKLTVAIELVLEERQIEGYPSERNSLGFELER